jgi:predicted Zn-dependent peptidase
VDTIEAVGPDDIVAHYRRHYTAPGLVITAAGGLDHDALCATVLEQLSRSGWPLADDAAPLPRRPDTHDVSGATAGRVLVVRRQIEQANVVLGTTGLTATDPRRYVMSVLNAVLGGGMSSRLFQEIREQRGLAYSVYSFASGHSDGGYFGLYAGCAPNKVDEVVTLLRAGLEALAADGVSEEELQRAHGQICGSLVLGLEDSGSRMSRLGKAELVHGEFVGLDTALERVRAVDAGQVQKLAVELAARPRSLAVVGPFELDRAFPSIED